MSFFSLKRYVSKSSEPDKLDESDESNGDDAPDEIGRIISSGNMHRDRREWSAAVLKYSRALELDESLPHIWVQLAHAHKEIGQLYSAKLAYEKASKLEPENADTQLHLGHLLKNLEEKQDAGQAFAKCLRHDKNMHDAYDQLLHLGWTRDDIFQAVPDLQELPDNQGSGNYKKETATRHFLFESVRQMMSVGKRPRDAFPQEH